MSKFSVLRLLPQDNRDFETHPEGAIDKYWLDLPDLGRSLVKVEKVTASLAEQLGLPVAICELVEGSDKQQMIASPTYLKAGEIEFAGERLLINAFGINYLYSPENVLSVLDSNNILLPQDFDNNPVISKASDLMVGYLIFDSWTGNIDRHCKNWGITQQLSGEKILLPTYDHGLSLGVRMPEDKLPLDLTDYSGSVRSSIYSQNGGTLSMNDLASCLLELRPQATNYWIERVSTIDRVLIEQTFDRLPDGWGSDIQWTFAIDLLNASRDRLILINQSIQEKPSVDIKIKDDRHPAPSSPRSPKRSLGGR